MPESKKTTPVPGGNESEPEKKERHIVTWTQQEDDFLREQVRLNGTDCWPKIALKLKDKTARQCRRRWNTYLNSDFKKGGWSPEEDKLLCEAQKRYGNRWTEIAKVVRGRTDNAVKNRFTTLCKKRAKYEGHAKEKRASCINPNGKRVIISSASNFQGTAGSDDQNKKLRMTHIQDLSPDKDRHLRPPFAVLARNFHCKGEEKECNFDDGALKSEQILLLKDDPKFAVLMQQAEQLISLAQKLNPENTELCLENAWKFLQNFINQKENGDVFKYSDADIGIQLQVLKDMVEDFWSGMEGSQTSCRHPSIYEESPASSEYSSGSTNSVKITHGKTADAEVDGETMENRFHVKHTRRASISDSPKEIISPGITKQEKLLHSCDRQTDHEAIVSVPPCKEFSSPLQLTPVFRSLAAGIPSPKFSESERNFLMKTLGMESCSPSPSTNLGHEPSCKRALLQSL